MRVATLHAAAPRLPMIALSHRVSISEHGVCEGVDAGGFPRPGRSADDEVRHVALFRDHLEPVQRLLVTHHLGATERVSVCIPIYLVDYTCRY